MSKLYTILGAGLSGIAVADHLNKSGIEYLLFEEKNHGGGHIHSTVVDGFTWDEGPHVSFTKHAYVVAYFAQNCDDEFLEYPPKPSNFFHQNWIPHPAQSNMFAIPSTLRNQCIADVITARTTQQEDFEPKHYQEWIDYAFGKTFANNFAKVYTEKYWTTTPENLSTDWIGKRVYFPQIGDMVASADGPIAKETHYITKVRYPLSGGYYSYIRKIEEELSIQYQKQLTKISFEEKILFFNDGTQHQYEALINTLPLPFLISISDAPQEIKTQAEILKCSSVLIVNVVVDHQTPIPNHWVYVYDADKLSTRINFTELLSPNNGRPGKSGIQVEVYFSDYHPLDQPIEEIVAIVLSELVDMKLAQTHDSIISYHHKWIKWANVIFDNHRSAAQNQILNWLANHGMVRETDDLEPMTEWDELATQKLGDVICAGRFAQWKYFWTDDCVMRAKYIAEQLVNQNEIL